MEAELFRDMPGLGIVISSKVLWPVTKPSSIASPARSAIPSQTIWGIPRIDLFPFQPIKTSRISSALGRKPAAARRHPPGKPEASRSRGAELRAVDLPSDRGAGFLPRVHGLAPVLPCTPDEGGKMPPEPAGRMPAPR
jgi:hypothetical protein